MTGELSIHGMGDDYTVEGNGTIKSMPTMPVGMSAVLRILGTPTFVNSTKLICQNGVNYVASPGDYVIARSDGDGAWRLFVLPSSGSNLLGAGIRNAKFVESNNGTAATFSLKTLNGIDPSTVDPVPLVFPDGSAVAVTAALSLTASSGSTLGFVNATPGRLWHCLINDAGTIRYGIRKCSDANGTYGFPATGALSSTAEGGAGAAHSAGVTYTGTAVSSKPFLILGYCDYNSGLTTAGTWAVSPSPPVMFAPGMAKPGDVVQSKQMSLASNNATTGTTYVDTGVTLSITPSSACNPVATNWCSSAGIDTANIAAYAALRRGGTVIGVPAKILSSSGGVTAVMSGAWLDAPSSAGSLTYTVAIKLGTASGTFTFNNTDSGSVLQLAEIMG